MAEADVFPVDREHIKKVDDPVTDPGLEDDVLARVGDRLRTARERLGMSREELSRRTKINERHLQALEDSDFTALPARIYAVGFARTYAGAVGLDSARIAAEVRRELNENENPPLRQPHQLHTDDPVKVPANRIVWIGLAVAAVLLIAGLVFWRSYFVPAVNLPPVREDVTQIVPELSPQAQISPTAESGLIAPPAAATSVSGSRMAATSRAVPAVRSAAPATRSDTPATQAIPASQPAAFEPVPSAEPVTGEPG